MRPTLALLLDGEVELELGGELLLAVEPVGEVDAADAAVGVDLDPQRLHVVGAVRPPGEVRQVELDLVPALVQSHRHRADERLHSGGGLVVAGSESSPHILIIEDLDLKCEIFLHVLHDHDEVWQLDAQGLLRVRRAGDISGATVGSYDLQHKRLKNNYNSMT